MECKFYVGQKVVCIDSAGLIYTDPNEPRVVNGAVYTVSEVSVTPWNGKPAIRTKETFHRDDNFSWMYARRFRPLVEKKTDISIFEKMLTPTKVPQNV